MTYEIDTLRNPYLTQQGNIFRLPPSHLQAVVPQGLRKRSFSYFPKSDEMSNAHFQLKVAVAKRSARFALVLGSFFNTIGATELAQKYSNFARKTSLNHYSWATARSGYHENAHFFGNEIAKSFNSLLSMVSSHAKNQKLKETQSVTMALSNDIRNTNEAIRNLFANNQMGARGQKTTIEQIDCERSRLVNNLKTNTNKLAPAELAYRMNQMLEQLQRRIGDVEKLSSTELYNLAFRSRSKNQQGINK